MCLPSSFLQLRGGSTCINLLHGSWRGFPPGTPIPRALHTHPKPSSRWGCPARRLDTTLPPGWVLPAQLAQLYLQNSSLAGPIPSNWTLNSALKVLQLQENDLSGSIPPDWQLPPALQVRWAGTGLLVACTPRCHFLRGC